MKNTQLEKKRENRDRANAEYLEEYLQSHAIQIICPHCGHNHCRKHGKTNAGNQRYFCTQCKKSFVYNKGTVFYRTWKSLNQWYRFLECYQQGQTLDVCARESQIHRNTALRWRHKVNAALNQQYNHEVLKGTVYLDETFFSRFTNQKADTKKKRGISDQKINICCAIDETGHKIMQVSATGRIKAENLIHVFKGKIKKESDLVSDSQRSYHRLMQELEVVWHKIPSHKKSIDHFTLDKVNFLHSKLKYYLHHFRRISYPFLQGYITMFRINEIYKSATSLTLTEELMVTLMSLKITLTCKMVDRHEVSWLVL